MCSIPELLALSTNISRECHRHYMGTYATVIALVVGKGMKKREDRKNRTD